MGIFRLRVELRAIRTSIEELCSAIQKHSESIHAAKEAEQRSERGRNAMPVIVSYDDKTAKDTKAEHAEEHKIQNSIKNWTIIAVIAAIIYATVAVFEWCEMQKATKAATRAAGVAQQQLDLSMRPWLMDELVSAGPIAPNADGEVISFAIQLTNVGHTPAVNVNVMAKVVNSQGVADIKQQQEELCLPYKNLPVSQTWGETIFPAPGKPLIKRFALTLGKTELDKTLISLPRTTFLPNAIGCVDYTVSYSGEHHQIGFFYTFLGTFTKGGYYPPNKVMPITGGYIGHTSN